MKMYVCAVRDRAADSFGTPIFVPAIGVAQRSFVDEINKKDSQWHDHADDFDLYAIGTYDTDTAALESETPRQLLIGKEVLVPEA